MAATRGWAGWWQYAKFSPQGITERKRGTASYSWSVLLSYKLICMWAFSSPLRNCHRWEITGFLMGILCVQWDADISHLCIPTTWLCIKRGPRHPCLCTTSKHLARFCYPLNGIEIGYAPSDVLWCYQACVKLVDVNITFQDNSVCSLKCRSSQLKLSILTFCNFFHAILRKNSCRHYPHPCLFVPVPPVCIFRIPLMYTNRLGALYCQRMKLIYNVTGKQNTKANITR